MENPSLRITDVSTQIAIDRLFRRSLELHRHTNLLGDTNFK
jgi:hypothetical protein